MAQERLHLHMFRKQDCYTELWQCDMTRMSKWKRLGDNVRTTMIEKSAMCQGHLMPSCGSISSAHLCRRGSAEGAIQLTVVGQDRAAYFIKVLLEAVTKDEGWIQDTTLIQRATPTSLEKCRAPWQILANRARWQAGRQRQQRWSIMAWPTGLV